MDTRKAAQSLSAKGRLIKALRALRWKDYRALLKHINAFPGAIVLDSMDPNVPGVVFTMDLISTLSDTGVVHNFVVQEQIPVEHLKISFTVTSSGSNSYTYLP